MKFQIVIECDVDLGLDELWPDGDAPENPTEEDVETLIFDEGGPAAVLRRWSLEEELEVSVRKVEAVGQ